MAAGIKRWTVADFGTLTDDRWRYEVAEGRLEVNPPEAAWRHAVGGRLRRQIEAQAPVEWFVDVELPVQIGDGWRKPDLVVVRADAPVTRALQLWQPDQIGLLVEVVSAFSTVRDRVDKPAQYTAAGIRYYWRVETEPTVVLHAAGVVLARGRALLPAPFPVEIDVDVLQIPPG
ncbi:MAG: Uma2 family endonuclease [Mycobacteriales bacterium]